MPTSGLRWPVFVLAIAFCAFGQTYTISTFAGGGFPDAAPAVLLSLGAVRAVAVDPAGGVLMALPDYHIVTRLNITTGLMTRVAGSGTSGYSGDGGPATSAQLKYPEAIAIDTAGNIYIADGGAAVVRRVSAGAITTVAGNGKPGFSGDNGPATSAQLNGPSALAVDANFNLFIADTSNQRLREVSGGIITTIAGDGAEGPPADGPAAGAHLSLPAGVAVDAAGSVYIADTYNHCVRKVSGGMIATVAGTFVAPFPLGDGGPATAATLGLPGGIAVDSSGNLYIADWLAYRVRMVAHGIVTTLAGNGSTGPAYHGGFAGDGGPATAAELSQPMGVAVDSSGNVYIADTGNMRVRKVSAGIIDTVAGHGAGGLAGDGGPPAGSQLSNPSGLAIDSQGNLYIADTNNHAVRMVSHGSITTVAGNGAAGYSGDGGPATKAQLNSPLAVAVDAAGALYVADSGNNVVRKVSGGLIATVANATAGTNAQGVQGLLTPSALAADPAGALYAATYYQYQERFPGGYYITVTAGQIRKLLNGAISPVNTGAVGYVGGMAVDSSGALYFSDLTASRVSKLSNGVVTAVAGAGSAGFSGDNGPATAAQLSQPSGIFLDAGGSVWIADSGNQRIRKVSGGVIATVAGAGPPPLQGMPQFGGDGGPAAAAQLNLPLGVVTDAAGRAFLADSANQRIRMLVPSDACTAAVQFGPLQFAASGGSLSAVIAASASCPWSVSGLPDWIAVSGPATGAGPATVTLVVAANPGPARTVTFAVAGNNATVSQAGATYTVSGHVSLAGQPLPGVFMGLTNQATGRIYDAQTDANGYYSIAFPAATSVYFLSAGLTGYSFLTPLGDGIFLTSAEVIPVGDQTRDFTAWAKPQIAAVVAAFPSATQPAPAAFAPGEIVSLFGASLCDGQESANAPLPNALGGCTVWFDSVKLPLYYSSPGQINAILPQNATAGGHALTVWRYTDFSNKQLAAQSDALKIQIAPVSMDFVERTDGGASVLAVQFQDGGFAGDARPVKPGDIVTLYLTGLGAKSQMDPDGAAPGGPAAALQQPDVLVENTPARILYAGAQPQYPGLDEIVLQLPQYTLPPGRNTVTVTIRAPSVSQSVTYQVRATT